MSMSARIYAKCFEHTDRSPSGKPVKYNMSHNIRLTSNYERCSGRGDSWDGIAIAKIAEMYPDAKFTITASDPSEIPEHLKNAPHLVHTKMLPLSEWDDVIRLLLS